MNEHRWLLGPMVALAILVQGPTLGGAAPAERNQPSSETQKPQPTETLDGLFARLAKAKDEAEAKGIGDQILRLWNRSGSDTTDLLMARVNQSIAAQNLDLALDLLDSIVALQPRWAEAYNRRATVLFLQKDYDGAMRDIRQTLSLEPRHFGALAGMSLVFQAVEDPKRALKAAEAALAIYPYLDGAKGYVERHRREVEGEAL